MGVSSRNFLEHILQAAFGFAHYTYEQNSKNGVNIYILCQYISTYG